MSWARGAAARSVDVVASLCRSALTDVGVSRIDPLADFGGLALKRGDLDGLVSTMDEVESHQAPRSAFVRSIRLRKFPLSCRIYDKRREIAKRGGFADLFYGDFDGPVGRVELEVGSQRLRDFGIRTFD